jgi:hypothetical protein
MYERGGFSKSYAEVTLKSGLPNKLADGTPISGKAVDGRTVTGIAFDTFESGATTIQIQYDTSSLQEVRVIVMFTLNTTQPHEAICECQATISSFSDLPHASTVNTLL